MPYGANGQHVIASFIGSYTFKPPATSAVERNMHIERANHNVNHVTAKEAPTNTMISFIKCTFLYLFWYQYEILVCPLTSARCCLFWVQLHWMRSSVDMYMLRQLFTQTVPVCCLAETPNSTVWLVWGSRNLVWTSKVGNITIEKI